MALRVESPALLAMRDALAGALHGLLTPQDQASPRLHVTIQNKVDPAQARALAATMAREVTPRPLVIAGLAAWRYAGGSWLPMKAMPFRG